MNASETMPASFEDLIQKHDRPVLVDFWADWCGPCRMIAPALEELAGEWKGRVTIVKINTDEKPDIAQQHGITALPTLVLFKDGAELHRVRGALPKAALKSQFERFI